MLTRRIDLLQEFFLWLLLFGMTFSNAVTEISVGFITFFFLIKRIIARDARPPKTQLNILLYLFLVVVFVSFLRSNYFNQSLRGFIRPLKYTVLYFSLIDFFNADPKRLKRFFWASMSVLCFSSLNGIFQDISGFDVLRHRAIDKLDYLHRISASFVHPNDFGAYLISVIPLSLSFLCSGLSKRKRLVLGFICLLAVYCLLRTSSRGAWLGLLVGVFIYFFYHKKKISVIIPIVFILFIVISPHGFSRMANMFKLEQNTIWERTRLWQGTWDMVKEHPLLGFGINTFSDNFPRYKPADYFDTRYTHNSYLQMWSEIGIVGLSVFLLIIFSILSSVSRNLRKKIKTGLDGFILLGMFTGCIGFLIHAAVDTNLYSLVLVTQFWVFTAYMISLNKSIEAKINA